MVATLSLGRNAYIDTLLPTKKIHFSNIGYLRRICLRTNEWREAQWGEQQGEGFRYQGGGYGDNAIVIACIQSL